MAKRSRAVSIASTTPRQGRCSARSPSIRRWCWRISRSTKSPMKSPPCKNCWRNSTWQAISSRATRCIVKKNLRSRCRRQRASDRSTQGQPAELASNGRGRLRRSHASFWRSDRRWEKAQSPRNTDLAVFDASPAVVGTQWEPYVAAIIQVERSVHAFQPATGLWVASMETSFYLSNHAIDANRAANAIRKHWGIENKSHYTRDVTLREDASRIRKNPGVFARMRS